jgi:hypothetical protein
MSVEINASSSYEQNIVSRYTGKRVLGNIGMFAPNGQLDNCA